MKLRNFTAASMPAALELVRAELGDEAIILSSQPIAGGKGVKVTAAIEQEDDLPREDSADDAPASNILEGPHAQRPAQQLKHDILEILRFHNLPETLIQKILGSADEGQLSAALAMQRISGKQDSAELQRMMLEKLLGDFFVFHPLSFNAGSKPMMLVGPPGIGKTLTTAKLAAKLAMEKKPLVVITTDNKRAGGIEQLQAFTDILGIELAIASSRSGLLAHLQDAPRQARILIDSAGCNPFSADEICELETLCGHGDVEPVLVLPAGGDSLEAIDIVENFSNLPIKRLLVTRADTARRFGGILAAAAAHGLAFCNTSGSPGVADPLEALSGAQLADMLLRYRSYTEASPMKMRHYDR